MIKIQNYWLFKNWALQHYCSDIYYILSLADKLLRLRLPWVTHHHKITYFCPLLRYRRCALLRLAWNTHHRKISDFWKIGCYIIAVIFILYCPFLRYRRCELLRPSWNTLRALAPLFGNGAGVHGIGKISGVLTKIGKFDIVFMYDFSIARLIPIIKLTLVYYEKRERKKQVGLYSIFLWNCKYVTICSVFVLYQIKMENPHTQKKIFFCQIGNFLSGIGKKKYSVALDIRP